MPYYFYTKKIIMGKTMPPRIPRPIGKMVPKMIETKRFLPKENLSLMMLTPKEISFLRGDSQSTGANIINMGDIVVKHSGSIEGISFGVTLFKVIGRIDSLNGVEINSFILKEVSLDERGNVVDANSNRQKITINKHICGLIGIDFQQGLELWPIETNFIRYEDFVRKQKTIPLVNYADMGTYPYNTATGCVEKICVELTGFRILDGGNVLTPLGETLPIDVFFRTLEFKVMGLIVKHNPISKDKGQNIKTTNTLCFELTLSDDNHRGISPRLLEGKNVDDVVTCSWVQETMPERLEFEIKENKDRVSSLREKEIFELLNQSMRRFDDEMDKLHGLIQLPY